MLTTENPVQGLQAALPGLRERAAYIPSVKEFKFFLYTFNLMDESPELYASLFECSPDPAIVTDENGEILLVNQQVCLLFGYSKEELTGQKIHLLIPERFAATHSAHVEKYAAAPEVRPMGIGRNLSARRKDGSEFMTEVSLSPVTVNDKTYFVASVRDVTERKIAAQKIEEQRYHALLDQMQEGLQIIGFDWRYLYVNDSLVKQSKYTREELVGFTMMEKYPGIEKTEMFRALKLCMQDRQARRFTNEFTFPDQTKGYFDLSLQPVEEGVLVLSADITERIRFKKSLISKNRKLENMNRELEQFVYIASHDLQEPLKTVSSCIRMLEKSTPQQLEENGETFLNFIGQATERMQHLIKALLDYSRIGKKRELKWINSNELLNDVITDMRSLITESGVQIDSGSLPQIYANPEEIRSLFLNLISNAIKFQKPGAQPLIAVTAEEDDEKWSFSVKDNGIGIDQKYLEKIFVIFQRLHLRDQYEGSGIGLAQCKKIVQLHEGEIHAESEPGKGSTFHFSISKNLSHE